MLFRHFRWIPARYIRVKRNLLLKFGMGDSGAKRRMPVVVVLGATGTGKSDLAVEMALRFGGEIISADSMQVYQGLDIVTNKVSLYETSLVPHHLINYVDPLSNYNVVDFRNRALPIMQSILERDKIPVIVGGTNYYIESLLWKVLVSDEKDDSTDESNFSDDDFDYLARKLQPETDEEGKHDLTQPIVNCESASGSDEKIFNSKSGAPSQPTNTQTAIQSIPNDVLHRYLEKIDPEMAGRLHPNNRRKVLRSLQVYEQWGRRHSEILKEQKSSEGGSVLGGPLRFSDVHIFWIRCDLAELDKRLDERVDAMLKAGLLQELSDFHENYNKQRLLDDSNSAPDYSKGIFQSIGFKEFHQFLILSEECKTTPEGQKLLNEGIMMMKCATKRYARYQLKWIRNRFLRCPNRQLPPVYLLDDRSPNSSRKDCVTTPALEIMKDLLEFKNLRHEPLPVQDTVYIDKYTQRKCTTCNQIVQGDNQWMDHCKSRKHKELWRKAKRKEIAAATGESALGSARP